MGYITSTAEEQYIAALEYRLETNGDKKEQIKHKKWITRNRKYFGVKEK